MSQEIDFRPATPPRANQVYLGWRLYKAFGMLARASNGTREDLVETILGNWLSQNHPRILTWLDEREADEKAFIKNLTPSNAKETKPEFVSETPT